MIISIFAFTSHLPCDVNMNVNMK